MSNAKTGAGTGRRKTAPARKATARKTAAHGPPVAAPPPARSPRPPGEPFRVTVFGGTGFIGRQVVRQLATRGCRVRVCGRDPERALALKTEGDVGQIVPVQANVRDDTTVRAAVDGADAVINLVGILFETERQRFDTVHGAASGRIARLAREAGAAHLVQMSALGADAHSPAAYGRSKAQGEAAVRDAFPDAVILRPGVVFGPEDDFFNRFAALMCVAPVLPLIGGGGQLFQPVYVGDVAAAVAMAALGEAVAGETYELAGPRRYSFREIMELIRHQTGRNAGFIPVAFGPARLMAFFMEFLPRPPLTRDQVALLQGDNVPSGACPGLADLGIEATAAEAILPLYLDIYRKGGRFSAPPADAA